MDKLLTVYKASAGSGKTFTLAARYIALLLTGEGNEHCHILAVTFTNKATGEMKGRILQRLWDLANGIHGDFSDLVLSFLPHIGVEELKRRAATALHAIVHDYDHFYVQTIDAFFQSILATLAHDMGLTFGYCIELDDKNVMERAVDRLLIDVNNRPDLIQWMERFIAEQVEEGRSWNVSKQLKMLATQINKESFLRQENELLPILNDNEFMKAFIGILYALKKVETDKLLKAVEKMSALLENIGGTGQFKNGRYIESYIRRLRKLELKEPSTTLQDYMSNAESMLKAVDRKSIALLLMASMVQRELANLEKLRQNAAFILNSCDLILFNIRPLKLIGQIEREMTAINNEENRFMLARTPILFDRLVGGDDASFVFERVGTQFHHVMIDEFQDTSVLQWNNFHRLLVENMAQGNSCLLVGDVKQAIYRFRGGDWKILEHIDKGVGGVPVEVMHMKRNFRSASNIIEFNNWFFEKAAALLDDIDGDQSIADIYADVAQEQNKSLGGYVEVTFNRIGSSHKGGSGNVIGNMSDEEANDDVTEAVKQMAAHIHHLHDDLKLPYSKMTILVRKNYDATELLNELAGLGETLPIVSDEAFVLESSSAVMVIISALRYLTDESNTMAKAYVCRAICIGGDAANNVDAAILPDWAFAELPPAFTANVSSLRSMTLYELCERLILIFDLQKRQTDAPFLLHLLDVVMNFMEEGRGDIADFLTEWDETLHKQAISIGDIDGIRIMTMHKAKGLSAHTVFIPKCSWDVEKNRRDELMWCTPKTKPFSELPLVSVKKEARMKNSIFKVDYETEHHDSRTESLNLLYVAFTRAERNLYVWADVKVPDENKKKETEMPIDTIGRLLFKCLDGNDYVVGQEVGMGKNKEDMTQETSNPLERLPAPESMCFVSFASRMEFRQSTAAKQFIADPDGNEPMSYIDRGKLLHYVFSTIHTLADVNKALTDLAQSGLLSTEKEISDIRQLVERRLRNPIARSWFDRHWKVYTENNILTRDETGQLEVRRPDRVLISGKTAIVIDFKFGHRKPEYRDQVIGYCRYLRRMGLEKVSGYLWYVYDDIIDTIPLEC